MIRYRTIQPQPSLRPFVRFYWVLESDAPGTAPYVHRTMADGCAELIFHYSGTFDELGPGDTILPSRHAHLHAQSRHYRRFRTDNAFAIFGVYLYPFVIPLLSGYSSSSASGHMPGLDELLGSGGKDLEEQIILAPDLQARIQIMNTWLERKLLRNDCRDARIFPAIRQVIHAPAVLPLQELSAQYYLSCRQFERKFSEYAGFAPKLYQRIIRFQKAIQEYNNKGKLLTQIAYDCGYYDQSHFIHDFKEFSGHHPRHYFSGKAEGTEWLNA